MRSGLRCAPLGGGFTSTPVLHGSCGGVRERVGKRRHGPHPPATSRRESLRSPSAPSPPQKMGRHRRQMLAAAPLRGFGRRGRLWAKRRGRMWVGSMAEDLGWREDLVRRQRRWRPTRAAQPIAGRLQSPCWDALQPEESNSGRGQKIKGQKLHFERYSSTSSGRNRRVSSNR